jgi:ribonucleoside-diphosphate reductase subunit M1
MRIPFEDPKAETINAQIFETIYHAAMTESVELAKIEGSYSSFQGSRLS